MCFTRYASKHSTMCEAFCTSSPHICGLQVVLKRKVGGVNVSGEYCLLLNRIAVVKETEFDLHGVSLGATGLGSVEEFQALRSSHQGGYCSPDGLVLQIGAPIQVLIAGSQVAMPQ